MVRGLTPLVCRRMGLSTAAPLWGAPGLLLTIALHLALYLRPAQAWAPVHRVLVLPASWLGLFV